MKVIILEESFPFQICRILPAKVQELTTLCASIAVLSYFGCHRRSLNHRY
jgi:hypothetical protein